jgi:leucyl aminopeptidase
MTVSVSSKPALSTTADLLVVPIGPEGAPLALQSEFGDPFGRAAEDAAAGSAPVAFYPAVRDARRMLLVPVPKTRSEHERLDALRVAAAQAAAHARQVQAGSVAVVLSEAPAPEVAALAEGFVLGSYRFDEHRTLKGDEPGPVERLDVHVEGEEGPLGAVATRAVEIAEAACLARDLVNLSPDQKSPRLLAERIQKRLKPHGVKCEVWDKKKITKEKMGGLLAVNRGSVEEPRVAILEHKPRKPVNKRPVVLVGKGVTFDTGGLSLKPTKGSMDKMKADMGGAAAVVGAMEAAARVDLPVHLVAIIPMTDNRPGGDAYVPGDVVQMRAPVTVEVLNTDAEGRMLLADGLDLAKGYDPYFVLDVATLTGAQRVALGDRVAAVMAPAPDTLGLVDQLEAAGERTGEYAARLPMPMAYADLLKSTVADLKNVGGREAGAITAGWFLQRFTQNDDGEPAYPWAHLDIAGPSFADSPMPYRPAGGTGFGVRLLVDMLAHLDA